MGRRYCHLTPNLTKHPHAPLMLFAPEPRWDTCVLFLAALALWYSKWWSYLIAVPLSARIAYKLSNHVLGSPLYIDRDAEGMLEYFKMQLEYHPEHVIHIVLAAIICCYATVCLLRRMFRRNRAMP
jgi:hypothetical protein